MQDLLAIGTAIFDTMASTLVAMYYGFAALPCALGFAAAAALALVWGIATPVSFQAETIVLVGGLGKDVRERLSIVVISGLIMLTLGGLGVLGAIVDFIGPAILSGMMAGVGIMLARAGIGLIKEERISAGVSFAVSLCLYFLTDNLVYMMAGTLATSTIVYTVLRHSKVVKVQEVRYETDERIIFRKPILKSPSVWRIALACCTLQIGGNISYGSITAQIANQPAFVDRLTVMSGIADVLSASFGGAPLEAIISATAPAPHPVLAAGIFMAIVAILLYLRLGDKIGKYVPVTAISGYIFVLGAIVVVPDNMAAALSGNHLVGGLTAVVTALTDPFTGMVAGILARFVTGG